MKAIEKTGRTVEEAVEIALQEMGVSIDEVDVVVLDEPSKGILGFFGGKPAKVKVSLREDSIMEKAQGLIKNVLGAMQLPAQVNVREKDKELVMELQGRDLGILIGRRGETLDALQYLINLSVNRKREQRKKIVIDIEGYRERRCETLRKLASKLADKARQNGRSVILEPMNAQERRIIHTALQERNDIYTFSEGEEPYRKIIISPKK
ncbi:MAG: protein jag [Peptococcaceae bacterium]|nr:MAG: protein jag [Peptococcaceae bacterium]